MTFQSAFLAIEHGAALIYHKVLATGVAVTAWEIDHPELAPLINAGLDYAEDLVFRLTGLPREASALARTDIMAALKVLAAKDATVPSVALTVTTTTAAHET